jgi:hypothetical protein
MLGSTAHVRSTCPVSGRRVQLLVAPDGVEHADPPGVHVSFPPLANIGDRPSDGRGDVAVEDAGPAQVQPPHGWWASRLAERRGEA